MSEAHVTKDVFKEYARGVSQSLDNLGEKVENSDRERKESDTEIRRVVKELHDQVHDMKGDIGKVAGQMVHLPQVIKDGIFKAIDDKFVTKEKHQNLQDSHLLIRKIVFGFIKWLMRIFLAALAAVMLYGLYEWVQGFR